MAEKATIIDDNGTQIVRLPDSVRFPDDQREVIVRREGTRIVLEPVVESAHPMWWSKEFLATFGAWKEEIELPPQRLVTESKDPFE